MGSSFFWKKYLIKSESYKRWIFFLNETCFCWLKLYCYKKKKLATNQELSILSSHQVQRSDSKYRKVDIIGEITHTHTFFIFYCPLSKFSFHIYFGVDNVGGYFLSMWFSVFFSLFFYYYIDLDSKMMPLHFLYSHKLCKIREREVLLTNAVFICNVVTNSIFVHNKVFFCDLFLSFLSSYHQLILLYLGNETNRKENCRQAFLVTFCQLILI